MKFSILKYKRNTLGGVLIHLLLAATLLVGLCVLYFFTYLPKTTNHGQTITVPNIEGMQLSQLEDFLVKRNLRYEINDSSYSEDYPPLTVLKQYPHAGAKVKEGRNIFISINRVEPPTVPVPNLLDGSVVNAEAVLKSNELKRGKIELVPGPFNVVKEMKYQGHVIAPTERVPKGSTIDLVVMDGGSKDFQAADYTGLSLEDAKVIIFGSNLNLGNVTIVGDTTGGAVVIRQKPEANENIKVGDVVDLWIGKSDATVPDDEEEDN
jgi:eukaryotic-like serine/threonine-protein kinase